MSPMMITRPQTIQTVISQRFSTVDLDETANILSTIGRLVGALDRDTREHCERLAEECRAFGEFLNLPTDEIYILMWGGYLHDIGKMAIPTEVLQKPGTLTAAEWEVMKQHTLIGESICAALQPLSHILPVIRHHHERWDGSGYPDGLAGNDIPDLAQIVQVLDVYDALTHPRCYKPAFSAQHALRIMLEDAAKGWYNPELIQAFLQFKAQAVLVEG
ncbi:MAG: HD-GYP domain-containing protein [Scytolyngbya sp. HA4215-MV1]|nr:HD-GYP domain-containing protein [Scytolyngbya sp. HA4215-MV1]